MKTLSYARNPTKKPKQRVTFPYSAK